MSTTHHSGQEPSGTDTEIDVDPRLNRACTGHMIVVPEGDASGLFEVYSAKNGHTEIYTVDLREGRCSCPDDTHRQPEGGCKHARRVRLALGISHPPAGVEGEIDSMLAHSRAKYGADRNTDTAPNADVNARDSGSAATAVATDGGQLLAAPGEDTETDATNAEPRDPCVHPDCHGDARGTTADTWGDFCSPPCGARFVREHEAVSSPDAHRVVLDTFVHDPVLDFDVFGEVIACSSASVVHAITTEDSA